MKLIGLADCNSFYASCEKVFRPDLAVKPVVVLSNNDGCIVAMSQEAKKMGIKRGTPYFKLKNELLLRDVSVFSSNYTLYQDMSDRIMDFIRERSQRIEIYSIDEAFFHIPEMDIKDASSFAYTLNRSIRKSIGMPVSIGMARTKTLAKIANHYAKKHRMFYVLEPDNERNMLSETPIDDVWGIGYRSIPKLMALGIRTALDFALCDNEWISRNFSICGLRTAEELRGIPCIEEENPERSSFSSSISFPKPVTDIKDIDIAVACHCSTVCSKLYSNRLKASDIAVQLITDRFNPQGYSDMGTGHLQSPSCYTPTILKTARDIVKKVWNPHSAYKSIRIVAWNLTRFENRQLTLFGEDSRTEAEDAVSKAVYTIGKDRILCATQSYFKKNNLANFRFLSPHYTTRWEDLPVTGRSDIRISQAQI